MNSNEEKIRAAIAEQAAEWFAASDEAPLDERSSAAFTAWLKTSPVHVEEFLGVSAIARDLKEMRHDPEFSVEAVLARARAEDDAAAQLPRPRFQVAVRRPTRRWLAAAASVAVCAVLSLCLFWAWNSRPIEHLPAPTGVTALHFETRHGEQLNRRLADHSVVHLDTDSAVTVEYGKKERLVTLTSGQADFEVVHQADRPFRVVAGSAEVVDLGTQFDVRLEHGSTLVTVVEGRVAVARVNSDQHPPSRFVQLDANQQLRVADAEWPATPTAIDAQRSTAWLRTQIVFDHEPLEHVAAEFNRYAPKPVEVTTPALRNLQISGVFATDDTDAFVASCAASRGCGSR